MPEPNLVVPLDFFALRGTAAGHYPPNFAREMGYGGNHRFVALWWDDEEDEVAWHDSVHDGLADGGWQTWTKAIAPFQPYLKANHGVHLGGSGEPATHVLLFDRIQQFGYLAPRESALAFMKEQLAKG